MIHATRIAVMTVPSPHSWIAINAIVKQFGSVAVIAERRVGRGELIRRRLKRQGPVRVAGQIGYVLLQKFIDRRQRSRIAEIIDGMQLDPQPNPSCPVYEVDSVNSMACRTAIAMLKPDVILVIGTRIIGAETLKAITVPLINFHSGWNPKYRGQAGGYWALAAGDAAHAGVTVHLVDAGVDTGDILYQAQFTATKADSFQTYYYLQAGVGRQLVVQAVADALHGELKPFKSSLPSQQFYHPTLWGYLWTAFTKGVW